MGFVPFDLYGTSPISVLGATVLLLLLVRSLVKNSAWTLFVIAVAGLSISLICAVLVYPLNATAFSEMVLVGGYATFFDVLFALLGILTLFLSESYLRKESLPFGEFYPLIVLSIIGMMLMGSAADLITFFLGLELMSVCFYILAGYRRAKEASNEAALKYFLLGAFATGFLLYGIALIYGTAGTTNLLRIAVQYQQLFANPWTIAGFGLLLIGFSFKVAAVPFHMWVPDVYEGSPTTVTGLMSTGGKAGAFAAFVLAFSIPMSASYERFAFVIAVLAAASMLVGNIFGLAQTNLKRMLAYSSIAHAGYMLVGVASGLSIGEQGILFYLVAYGLTNVGAFGVLSLLEEEEGGNLSYEDYAGLSGRHPYLAALLAMFLFSLTGVPPFAGFVGKYYLFASAVQAHMTWLAVLGVLTSLLSAYYYLRVVVYMYFREAARPVGRPLPKLGMISLVIAGAGVLLLGVFPSLILDVTSQLF